MPPERVADVCGEFKPYESRTPCPRCDTTQAMYRIKNGQHVVFCAKCRQYLYCAPLHETGEKPRSVQVAHTALSPKVKYQIKERATGRCEICGAGPASGVILNVAHILSVKDGLETGCTIDELNNPENLACMCEECNLGMGAISLSSRMYVRLLKVRCDYLAAQKRSGRTDGG